MQIEIVSPMKLLVSLMVMVGLAVGGVWWAMVKRPQSDTSSGGGNATALAVPHTPVDGDPYADAGTHANGYACKRQRGGVPGGMPSGKDVCGELRRGGRSAVLQSWRGETPKGGGGARHGGRIGRDAGTPARPGEPGEGALRD